MGGDDIRGVQLKSCYKHSVGVFDDGNNTGGSDDRSDGAAGGGDIRGVVNMTWSMCCLSTIFSDLDNDFFSLIFFIIIGG